MIYPYEGLVAANDENHQQSVTPTKTVCYLKDLSTGEVAKNPFNGVFDYEGWNGEKITEKEYVDDCKDAARKMGVDRIYTGIHIVVREELI